MKHMPEIDYRGLDAHEILNIAWEAAYREFGDFVSLERLGDGTPALMIGSEMLALGDDGDGMSWTAYRLLDEPQAGEDPWEDITTDGAPGPDAGTAAAEALDAFIAARSNAVQDSLQAVRSSAAALGSMTESLRAAVREAANDRHAVTAIAEAAGVGRQTIYRWLDEN